MTPGASCWKYLIEHMLDLMTLLDREAQILYASPSVTRTLGWSSDELIGEVVFSFMHPEDVGPARAKLARAIEDPNVTATFEGRARKRDGRYRDFEVRAFNMLDNPEVGALVVTGRDVTERNERELRLREQDARFQLLADSARDIITIFQFDPPGIQYISPAVERLTGYAPADFYADPEIHERLIHPDDFALQREMMALPLEELAKPTVLRWLHRDGHTVWLEQLSVPAYDESGRPVALHTISRDVTEKVQLEEQLRRGQRMEALGRLAGGIAHDFNNLLAAALLSTDRLRRHAQKSGDSHFSDGLSDIRAAVERGVSLTQQLLAFSQRHPEPAHTIDVHRTIHELEAVLRRLLPENILLTVDLGASRPFVRIGRSQLEQAVLNLVINARDAMPEGGTLSLETLGPTASGAPQRLVLRVRDDGLGMDEEVTARIFEPFFTTKGGERGHGLGLSVVYGVVQNSGGTIEVTSSPGAGALVEITWPVSEEPPDAGPAHPVERTDRGAETVLVVEDDTPLRRLIVEVLSAHGYRVLTAGDAEQALRSCAQIELDLLLTDLVLPGRSGRALAEELAAERDAFAILYISGYREDRSLSGAGHFLAKPFSEEQLTRAVRDAIDGRRS